MRTVLDEVKLALGDVEDPCSESLGAGWSVVDMGLVTSARVDDDSRLVVEVALTDPLCPFYEVLESRMVAALVARTSHVHVELQISTVEAWAPARMGHPSLKRGDPSGQRARV